MKERVRLRHIKVFLSIAEEGNVTRAAERLGTAQPAVSRSLRELEEFIGCSLFERTSSGLVPTKAGERFWTHAHLALKTLDQGIFSAREGGDVEALTIGALPNLIRNVLPVAVAQFKSQHPNVPVRIQTGTNIQLLNALELGSIDLVIGRLAAPEVMQSLTFETLWEEELIFAASPDHPLASLDRLDLDQINQFEVIIPEPGTTVRTELDRILLAAGISRFSRYIETISAEFARAYISQFPAIFVFPKGSVLQELETGSIVRLSVSRFKSEQPVGVSINPSAQKTLAMQLFLSFLRTAAREKAV